jgi:hypothetical protein
LVNSFLNNFFYSSEKCQLNDWNEHKYFCIPKKFEISNGLQAFEIDLYLKIIEIFGSDDDKIIKTV